MYSIGQVAKMFDLPISTLRYYDKEGLFPQMERVSGMRRFGEHEIETLRVIECLKKSGLSIQEIKDFVAWCTKGSQTYQQRLELFEHRKQVLQQEMESIQKTLNMVNFKCWYYTTALKQGNEEGLMDPDHMPPEVQEFYRKSHEPYAEQF